jgi:hypothetical protein
MARIKVTGNRLEDDFCYKPQLPGTIKPGEEFRWTKMTYLENPWKMNNFNEGFNRWIWFCYHLAPLFFSEKPAVAMNRTIHFYGQDFGGPIKDEWNALAPDFVCRVFRLGSSAGRFLILYYRPGCLQETLNRTDNRELLHDFGYGLDCNLEGDLAHLQARLRGPFPHEIGIFLGIPAHDVVGFMVNQGKNYLLNRYWKVYHNPEQARRVFDAFDAAKQTMARLIGLGSLNHS